MTKRLDREKLTLNLMIEMYCRRHHAPSAPLCPDCASLLAYALQRIDHCPHGEAKPVCSQCPIHCFAPAERTRIRQIMRFSGPRMLLSHPILAALHFRDRLLHRSKHPANQPL